MGFGLGFSLPSKLRSTDAVLFFAIDASAVKRFAAALKKTPPSAAALLWVAVAKGGGVDCDSGWASLTAAGYDCVDIVEVNDLWSACRFVRR